jgi:hypothetical protein
MAENPGLTQPTGSSPAEPEVPLGALIPGPEEDAILDEARRIAERREQGAGELVELAAVYYIHKPDKKTTRARWPSWIANKASALRVDELRKQKRGPRPARGGDDPNAWRSRSPGSPSDESQELLEAIGRVNSDRPRQLAAALSIKFEHGNTKFENRSACKKALAALWASTGTPVAVGAVFLAAAEDRLWQRYAPSHAASFLASEIELLRRARELVKGLRNRQGMLAAFLLRQDGWGRDEALREAQVTVTFGTRKALDRLCKAACDADR